MPPENTPVTGAPLTPIAPPRSIVKDLFIPAAILIAGIILAVAIYVVRLHHTLAVGTGNPTAVSAVTPTDHIIGNPTAPIIIIEYADIESTYSKSFQLTMEQIMTEYAKGGKVAWVYRHFPNTIDHPSAATDALAAECAGALTVPTNFFRFIDAIQAAAPGDNQFNPNQYSTLLPAFNISQDDFNKCMTAGTYTKEIHDEYDNALASGATGSPFVVLLEPGAKPAPINGALPYLSMKKIIDDAISKLGS